MKLSVVIPIYNAEKHLKECVDSVLDQTYRDYEMILVDDGSTDGSKAICREYAERYPFVKVISQSNAGASAARNAGLRAAKGEYVHFIDSDDMLAYDNAYADLSLKALDGENQIIFFRRERIREGVEGIDAIQPEYKADGRFCGDVLKHVLSSRYILTMTCPVNKIFLRSFLIENELYFGDGLEHEEDEWLPRVISCADKVWFDKGVIYRVRNHPASMSNIKTEEKETSRARSKVIIASTGMEYMENKALSDETLTLTAEYYWDYLIDACVMCGRLRSEENRRTVIDELKKHRDFFKSSRYLNAGNRKMLGVMFRTLGVENTVKIIGKRYGKQS